MLDIERAFRYDRLLGGTTRKRELKWLKWSKPNQGWLAVNIDECVNQKDLKAGCRGVIRDEVGNWITCFISNLGYYSADFAEAWAVLMGFRLAWEKGMDKIIIMSDSNKIIKCLEAKNLESIHGGQAINVFLECRKFMKKRWEIKVKHTFREQNIVTDALAKESAFA